MRRSVAAVLASVASATGSLVPQPCSGPANETAFTVAGHSVYEVSTTESCSVRTVYQSANTTGPAFYGVKGCSHPGSTYVTYFHDGLHYVNVTSGAAELVPFGAFLPNGSRPEMIVLDMAWWPAVNDSAAVLRRDDDPSAGWTIATPKNGKVHARFANPANSTAGRASAMDTDKSTMYIPFNRAEGGTEVVVVELLTGQVSSVLVKERLVHLFYDSRVQAMRALYVGNSSVLCGGDLPPPPASNPRATSLTLGRLVGSGFVEDAVLTVPECLRWHAENDFNPATGRYAYYAQKDKDATRGDFYNGVGAVDIPLQPKGTLTGTASFWGFGLPAAAWSVCSF